MDPALRRTLSLEVDPKEHRALIEQIVLPHTIRFLAPQRWPCNCMSYAFGLVGEDEVEEVLLATGGEIRLGRDFANTIIFGSILVPVDQPTKECLVTYHHASGEWRHIGRMVNADRVRSRWSTYPVYEHGIWEVPLAYGSQVRFFNPIEPGEALALFLDYAERKAAEIR